MLSAIAIAFLEEVRDVEPVDAGAVVVGAEHFGLPVEGGAGDVAEAGAAEAEGGGDVGAAWGRRGFGVWDCLGLGAGEGGRGCGLGLYY